MQRSNVSRNYGTLVLKLGRVQGEVRTVIKHPPTTARNLDWQGIEGIESSQAEQDIGIWCRLQFEFTLSAYLICCSLFPLTNIVAISHMRVDSGLVLAFQTSSSRVSNEEETSTGIIGILEARLARL